VSDVGGRSVVPVVTHPAGVRESAVPNLPNMLTGLRLALAPVLALVLAVGGQSSLGRVVGLGVFAAACVTDVADGHLARSRGLVTAFGALMDPIADKAILATALVALSALGTVPWWVTGVVLGRELVVTLARLAVLNYGVISANRGGKAKAVSQCIAIAVCLVPLPAGAQWLRTLALAVAVVLTVVTGLEYVAQAVRLRRSVLGSHGAHTKVPDDVAPARDDRAA